MTPAAGFLLATAVRLEGSAAQQRAALSEDVSGVGSTVQAGADLMGLKRWLRDDGGALDEFGALKFFRSWPSIRKNLRRR